MTHEEERAKIVAEARSWIGTPYISNAAIKGKRGGVDCAMLLLAVYADLGYVPKEFDPRPYSPQWHVHMDEEKYINAILKFSYEFPGPPEPGDIAMFLIGRVHAHGGIVTSWPWMVHALSEAITEEDDISKYTTGKRALAIVPKRYFTLWSPEA